MNHEEHVDVIDEKGVVLRVVTKQEAHTEGLLHKTVISEVIDSKGRWLLVKQAADRQDPGQYVSPVGGHVSAGESNEDALKREAEEELGLTGEFKYEHIGDVVFNRETRGKKENHLFVVYKIYSDDIPVLNHEAVAYEYFTEDELRNKFRDEPEFFGAAFHFLISALFPELKK